MGRFLLGNGRYAVVCNFKGKVYFNIRQYELKGNREYPTITGTCMSAQRFAWFMLKRQQVTDAVREVENGSETVDLRDHIGGGVHVALKSGINLVNIRKYFLPHGAAAPIPTRMGIALKFSEWEKLMECIDDVKNLSSELMNAEPCFNGLDHANLMGFLQCRECSPFGSELYL